MAPSSRSAITRRQLCLAAEHLVAAQGIGVATLRNVAQTAGQRNTAAVSYHFGTIEELLRGVIDMRVRDSEPARGAMIAQAGQPLASFSAFQAWRCVTRPYFHLPDEQTRHAHVRFLLHMSVAGRLSDPLDDRIERPGAPGMVAALAQLHRAMAPLPVPLARTRISLAGLMMWNAVALHDNGALGSEAAALPVEALLDDVEQHVRVMLAAPAESDPR